MPALRALLLACAQAGGEELVAPPGSRVEIVAPVHASLLNLVVEERGKLLLATESQGILRATDLDGDGTYERVESVTEALRLVQGLARAGELLYAVGRRASDSAQGVWRLRLDAATGAATGEPELLIGVEGDDEHGAHALRFAPGGELLLSVGDSASLATPPQPPLPEPDERELVPPLPDPSGLGARQRWPYGHLARIEPASGSWSVLTCGLRNAFDFDWLADGTLVTVDSDMEWDLGLPWYRPVRVLECRAGADHGSRPGSAARAMQREARAVLELGRGSPTGLATLRGASWPESLRGALVVGDWANGRLVAVYPQRVAGELVGAAETLVQARGALPVTGLAEDERGLLFVAGGRGAMGRVWRLSWTGDAAAPRPSEPPAPDPERRAAEERRRARVAALVELERRAARGEAGAELIAAARDAVAPYPCGDAAVDRELAPLVAWLDEREPTHAGLERLLTALEREPEPVEAIHLANVLRAVRAGWSAPRLARALAFFERAAGFTGGGNLQGYLDAMLRELAARASAADVRALAEEGRLGPRALATFLARGPADEVGYLVAPLGRAFESLEDELDPPVALAHRRALLRSLAGARAEGLDEWLRAVHEREPRLAEDVLQRLAERPAAEDRARFVAGLASGRFEVREDALRALRALAPRATADEARSALDQARRRGERAGQRLLALLEHWSAGELSFGAGEPWEARLTEAERWFARTHPDWVAPARGPADGPDRPLEALAAFLERAAERPGDAGRGALVYQARQCASCHALSTSAGGGGWGPDLLGVTHRFDARTVLAAVLDPSREIAERFALSELATRDGERLEGRVIGESAAALELALASGERRTVARADVAALAPSPISAMPEGLLAGIALEDLRDLWAYLAADGPAPAGEDGAEGWRALFDDAQRRHWSGALAGWVLDRGVLAGTGGSGHGEPLSYAAGACARALELDVSAEGEARLGIAHGGVELLLGRDSVELRTAEPSGARALPEGLDASGWRHVRIDLVGGRALLEVDGIPVAEGSLPARGSTTLTLRRPTVDGARVWIANLRLLR